MTIETVCPECGKSYRVRDEMAGKRFRCKACQSAVSIPVPSDDLADDDAGEDTFDDDFLGGLDTAVKAERRSSGGTPPPIADRSPTQKKSRSQQKDSGGNGAGAKVLITLVSLIAGGIGFVVGYQVVTALLSGGSGAAAWEGFTSPDGTWQAEFPAVPQLQSPAGAAQGAQRYVGETPQVGAAVTQAPLPPDAADRDVGRLVDQFTARRPGAAVSGQADLTFGEHPAREVTLTLDADGKQLANTTRIVLMDDAVYTLEFISDGSDHAADRDRFFNSFALLNDRTARWSAPAPP